MNIQLSGISESYKQPCVSSGQDYLPDEFRCQTKDFVFRAFWILGPVSEKKEQTRKQTEEQSFKWTNSVKPSACCPYFFQVTLHPRRLPLGLDIWELLLWAKTNLYMLPHFHLAPSCNGKHTASLMWQHLL